ncbi:hypothetical protein SEA_SUCHA_61 [Microbacterium phage Sucha]|nr:hypothetical protein SEA_SUCHA_61 [Microbacterium phage Sucha]
MVRSKRHPRVRTGVVQIASDFKGAVWASYDRYRSRTSWWEEHDFVFHYIHPLKSQLELRA